MKKRTTIQPWCIKVKPQFFVLIYQPFLSRLLGEDVVPVLCVNAHTDDHEPVHVAAHLRHHHPGAGPCRSIHQLRHRRRSRVRLDRHTLHLISCKYRKYRCISRALMHYHRTYQKGCDLYALVYLIYKYTTTKINYELR